MATFLSVIICTHNPGASSLQRVLDALKKQTLAGNRWELLLIDNVSENKLSEIWDLSWQPNGRHVREDEIGLTPARLRGIKESTGELLVFIDDDNVLAPDFLERACAIADRCPHLGVFGTGRLEPEFETPPPPELVPKLSMLALRTVSAEQWSNNPKDASCYPWGAGLCATRQAAIRFDQLVRQLNIQKILGRRGQKLFCGEDDLFSWAAAADGQGFGIFPELQITHLISSGRLKQNYFLRLIHDQQFSQAVMAYLLTGATQSPRISLGQMARVVLRAGPKGAFAARFEWASTRGRQLAGHFIRENRLQPINHRSQDAAAAAAQLQKVLSG